MEDAMKTSRLKGDVALVTGAASGLDKAVAIRLGLNGAVVVCADLNLEGAQETANEINKAGGEAFAIRMNIADRQSVADGMKKAYEYKNKLNIFVNGAGVAGLSTTSLDTPDDKDWDRMILINLTGYYYCATEIAKYMKLSGGGRVVMFSSSSAKSGGSAGGPGYAAAKGGVISLSRHCARYWAKYNIRCNCICPGFNPTNFGPEDPNKTKEENEAEKEKVRNMFREKAKKEMPLGRTCDPEDIAGAVLFLVSEESSYITGISLDVTGGQYIYNA